MIAYKILKILAGSIVNFIYKPTGIGLENIPKEGPAILASNHLSVVDSLFLPLAVDRQIVFIGKSDYFTGKSLKGRIIASFMKSMGVIPVDRSGGKGQSALDKALERLESGELFGIYPEGTRSPNGKLYKGKVGVAKLALQSGAPIIPVAMVGTDIAQPIGKKLPLRGVPIQTRIGKAIDISKYENITDKHELYRTITDELMRQIQKMSGQDYVDKYAADVKKDLAKKGLFDGPIPNG